MLTCSSNILYPKEDTQTSTLMFECRTCRWSCQADTSCIYRNELSTTIGATAGVTQDVSQDPTVGNPSFHAHSIDNDTMALDGSTGGGGGFSYDEDDMYDAHGHEFIPDMCMLCGDEIYCDVCGEESYGGAHAVVDELGRISSVRVHASQDGNVGSFVVELPQTPLAQEAPQLPQPDQQQLQVPLEQLQLYGQQNHQTPSPPPTPPQVT